MYPQQMYKDFLLFWDFLPENWEILHIFSIGKGAHNGPQNQPRKIPGICHFIDRYNLSNDRISVLRHNYQSGTKPKQVIKKITETSYFSFSLYQSKSVNFFLI